MQIPNFLTEEGSILYKNTVGRLISPRVGEMLIDHAAAWLDDGVRRVLDIGCGPGTVSLNLARKYPDLHITGIDASAAMIRQCEATAAQEGLRNTGFTEMNAAAIEFPESSFDLIVSNLAFPFFAKPKESMRGIHSALRRGGCVIVSVPGRNTWKEFFEVAEEALGDSLQFAKPFLTKFDRAEVLPPAMEEAGFGELTVAARPIPFTFRGGNEVLNFFQELFALLSYVPEEIKNSVSEMIDTRFPHGFTMHYEAILVCGKRLDR